MARGARVRGLISSGAWGYSDGMCGRYLLISPIAELRRVFGVADPGIDLAPRWNIAPTTECLAVLRNAAGLRAFARLRWGLVPSWARDAGGAACMINARGETVAEKPAYRDALRRRRCLIPADGFYEWPETGADRRPVLFRRDDLAPFAFAGLWEDWTYPDGSPLRSFAIVNTEARGKLRAWHHRVPIALDADQQARWLDPDADPLPLVAGPAFEDFSALRVTTHVNAVRNDDPRCVAPAPEIAEPSVPPPRPSRSGRDKRDARQGSLF